MAAESRNIDMLAKLERFQAPDGFVKTKYLGSGAWKVAFQASSAGSIVDVALLCYHGKDTKNIADDASKLLRLVGDHEFASYVARVHNIHVDDDHNVWIAEELLTSSLDQLSPMVNIRRFCEIARDISRGLTFIHSKGLVHRDLKLDNCGFDDQAQVAKIFDVGSVTSEPGGSVCTILTRAPEFFRASGSRKHDLEYRKEADIWALGATLYALRTGDYPFVKSTEVAERSRLGELLATREIERAEYQQLKADLDKRVTERITDIAAEDDLFGRLQEHFREGSLRLMMEMLSFSVAARRTAAEYQAEWSTLTDCFTKPLRAAPVSDPKKAIVDFLEAVNSGQLVATLPQIESCASRLNGYRKKMSAPERKILSELVASAKSHVKSFWATS